MRHVARCTDFSNPDTPTLAARYRYFPSHSLTSIRTQSARLAWRYKLYYQGDKVTSGGNPNFGWYDEVSSKKSSCRRLAHLRLSTGNTFRWWWHGRYYMAFGPEILGLTAPETYPQWTPGMLCGELLLMSLIILMLRRLILRVLWRTTLTVAFSTLDLRCCCALRVPPSLTATTGLEISDQGTAAVGPILLLFEHLHMVDEATLQLDGEFTSLKLTFVQALKLCLPQALTGCALSRTW